MIYWFVGQPGSGKTILANLLKDNIFPHAFRIDGDEMREIFQNKDYFVLLLNLNLFVLEVVLRYSDQY